MIAKYDEEEFLLISNIQHYVFCKRQWALIRIEGVWEENFLTAQGRVLHDRVDDPWFNELRKDMVIARSMPLVSYRLNFQGVADLVEFKKSALGTAIKSRSGLWEVIPVEYKRGKPKQDSCDEVQLCMQAICLEEMLNTQISSGKIFYGSIKRRVTVEFSDELRNHVEVISREMHQILKDGQVPLAEKKKSCKSCSLVDLCKPDITDFKGKVNSYINKVLGDVL